MILPGILHARKSFTGVEINRRLSRSGRSLAKRVYDHLIRDGEQLNRAIRIRRENPARLG